jgi:GNAT superfamily N-acetyltransferase
MIRIAAPHDADALSALLFDVFADDTFFVHTFDTPDRVARLRAHFAHQVNDAISAGHAFCDETLSAVALWDADAPGIPRVLATPRERPARYLDCIRQLAPFMPSAPVLYLNMLATHTRARGRGLASALVRERLVWADVQPLPVYLETQHAHNVGFYNKLGFEVTAEIDGVLPGQRMWGMLKKCKMKN